ncbi:hypothetical protein D3C71_1335200 [compost metagenome]
MGLGVQHAVWHENVPLPVGLQAQAMQQVCGQIGGGCAVQAQARQVGVLQQLQRGGVGQGGALAICIQQHVAGGLGRRAARCGCSGQEGARQAGARALQQGGLRVAETGARRAKKPHHRTRAAQRFHTQIQGVVVAIGAHQQVVAVGAEVLGPWRQQSACARTVWLGEGWDVGLASAHKKVGFVEEQVPDAGG